MHHDITDYIKTRYSAKAFDPSKKIAAADVEKLKELLRFAPSSVNSQPWHFIIASSDEAKAKIAQSAEAYGFNKGSILNASHVVVFCAKTNMDETYLKRIVDQEDADGRFPNAEQKEKIHSFRNGFISTHSNARHWMEKQVYINLGCFLLGVAALGLDAVPMEGFDPTVVDAAFGLHEKGLASVVIVPIGYSDHENDYNRELPKSRLPYADILTDV